MYWNQAQVDHNERLFEIIEWTKNSPWYYVKKYLLNRGYTIKEINNAAQAMDIKQ